MLKALGLTAVDLLGVASAVAASTTAWMQLKQYKFTAVAYTVTAHELEPT
jgi:hypothetical protein